MNYKVVPINAEIARSVRRVRKSPQYGHPAFTDVARGYGPCRVCLKTFVKGKEERILFTYNAFENLSSLPAPGPVYIHKDECRAYDAPGFPPELLDLPLLLESYGAESELVSREAVNREKLDRQINEVFAVPDVDYINIRNSEAGCFVARIVRL